MNTVKATAKAAKAILKANAELKEGLAKVHDWHVQETDRITKEAAKKQASLQQDNWKTQEKIYKSVGTSQFGDGILYGYGSDDLERFKKDLCGVLCGHDKHDKKDVTTRYFEINVLLKVKDAARMADNLTKFGFDYKYNFIKLCDDCTIYVDFTNKNYDDVCECLFFSKFVGLGEDYGDLEEIFWQATLVKKAMKKGLENERRQKNR